MGGFVGNPTQRGGVRSVAALSRQGTEILKVTVNYCDPCTWFCAAIESVDETLTKDELTYSSTHINWIDLWNGRLHGEFRIRPYRQLVVRKDGVILDWLDGYTINYEAGTIAFDEDQGAAIITATYWYADACCYVLAPDPGTKLILEGAVVNVSDDVADTFINTPIVMEIRIGDPPGLTYETVMEYKSLAQVEDEAQHIIQGRNSTKYELFYRTRREVPFPAWIWIGLGGDGKTPIAGTRTTGTFSGVVEDI